MTPPAVDTAQWATYAHPNGLWSVKYPSELLHVEQLGPDLTIFISQDRATVAAVDTYVAGGNEYGNTGEELRNRARDVLDRIYGTPVQDTRPIERPEGRWETGITFTTALGSTGRAVYEQRGRQQGNLRVYGFLYGHKAHAEQELRPVLAAMRESFSTP